MSIVVDDIVYSTDSQDHRVNIGLELPPWSDIDIDIEQVGCDIQELWYDGDY